MVLLVDSREQRKLVFGCDTKVKALKFGDYGAMFSETHQHPVVFERKSIADLYGTCTFQYDRFRKCFERAEKARFKFIIAVEGTKEKVLLGYKHSSRDPATLIKQLETIERKYGVVTMFFPSRIAMQNYIVDYYQNEYEKFIETVNQLPENL